jgi:hypothetical protein
MPSVVCPYCKTWCDVPHDDSGKPVPCVTCLRAFSTVDQSDEQAQPTKRQESSDDPDADYYGWRGGSDADYERRYGTPRTKPRTGLGTTSLQLGLSALVLCLFPPVSMPVAVVAILLGALAQRTDAKARGIAGIVLGVLALLIGSGLVVLYLVNTFASGRSTP